MEQVAGQLFGVTVEAADGKAPVWNSDVRFFCIKQDGKPKAYFFFVSPWTLCTFLESYGSLCLYHCCRCGLCLMQNVSLLR